MKSITLGVGFIALCAMLILLSGTFCAALLGSNITASVLFFTTVFVVWPCSAIGGRLTITYSKREPVGLVK